MYPKSKFTFLKSRNTLKKQTGISMAFLLFTIIIVSLLAAALMRLNSESSISNANQVIATRAFFAAETGAQIQALTLFPVVGAGACINPPPYSFTTNGLSGCTATTTCAQFTIDGKNYYQVTSTGQCSAGQPLQATRVVQVRLKDIDTP